jgi:hypothetical protein
MSRTRSGGRRDPASPIPRKHQYYVIVENPTYGILTKANFNVHLKVIGRP